MKTFNDNPKNIYVIKHKLAELTQHPNSNCFYYYVGNFIVKIFTHETQDVYSSYVRNIEDRITHHEKVDVNLYEWTHSKTNYETRHETYIDLNGDTRFINFKPIHHNFVQGIPIQTGRTMPIINLCELIRYLHRLSNSLAIFY